MSDQNMFGGKNKNGLYVPMSETEQEVLERLIQSDDLYMEVHGWGTVNRLDKVSYGDHRLSVYFTLSFDRPAVPVEVHFFDLELKTRAGLSLCKQRMPLLFPNGNKLMAGAGLVYNLAWDIAIDHMDPQLVKALNPGATGLTSRRQDRDTKDFTRTGNMQLNENQRRAIQLIEMGEQRVRKEVLKEQIDASVKTGLEVKKTSDGIVSPTPK